MVYVITVVWKKDFLKKWFAVLALLTYFIMRLGRDTQLQSWVLVVPLAHWTILSINKIILKNQDLVEYVDV